MIPLWWLANCQMVSILNFVMVIVWQSNSWSKWHSTLLLIMQCSFGKKMICIWEGLIIVKLICHPTWIASCFFSSLLTIFSSNVARKRMLAISLSTSLPKSSMQEEFMTRTTSRTYLSRIVFFSSWISNIKDPRFDLSIRIQTQSME